MKDLGPSKSSSNTTQLFYYKGVSEADLNAHKELLEDLMCGKTNSGANVEKLKGCNVYSIRINQKGRILFTRNRINGADCIIVLEILNNHEYGKAKFLKKHVLKQYAEDENVILENIKDDDFEPVSENLSKQVDSDHKKKSLDFQPVYKQNGNYLSLDDEQKSAFTTKTPLIIEGPPGSGKTSVALALLEQAVDAFDIQEIEAPRKILYVTQSEILVRVMKAAWKASAYEENQVEIIAYKDLETGLRSDGEEVFQKWFKELIEQSKDIETKKFLTKNEKLIYQEFRTHSGYTTDKYTDEKVVGKKQNLFQEQQDKTIISEHYNVWRQYLADNDIKLIDFYELGENQEPIYDMVIVDEAQDLSHGQLRTLFRMTKDNNLVYCIDPRQNLNDENPKLIYLKSLLTDKMTNVLPSVVQLSTHYRCPEPIMNFASVFNEIRLKLAPKNKAESKFKHSDIPGGDVTWIEPNDNAALDEVKLMATDVQTCVVTPKAYRDEAKKVLRILQVFTPEEVKGLEFDTVVLYKILQTNSLVQANNLLVKKDPTDKNPGCLAELSACFVAATRAKKSLIMIENSNSHKANEIISKLKEKITTKPSFSSDGNAVANVSSLADWASQYARLIERNLVDQANTLLDKHFSELRENSNEIQKALQKKGLPYKNVLSQEQGKDPVKNRLVSGIKATGEEKSAKSSINNKGGKIHHKKKKKFKGTKRQQASCPIVELKEIEHKDQNILLDYIKTDQHTKVSQWLKNKSCSANSQMTPFGDGKKRSLLVLAAYYSSIETIKILLKNGANINLKSIDGKTALQIAVSKNHIGIVKLLLETKADVNSVDDNGMSALFCACERGDMELVSLLLKNGANINLKSIDGKTALLIAADKNHTGIVKLLLESKADVNSVDDNGNFALFFACNNDSKELVSLLLEKGADINQKAKEGSTSLYIASFHKRTEMVRLLLDSEADVNSVDDNGMSALFCACEFGSMELVSLLLEKGANINQKSNEGYTSLHIASFHKQTEIVRLLLDSEADVNSVDDNGKSALLYACERGSMELVSLLLNKGANIKQKSKDGLTSLHIASFHKQTEIVRLLLDSEADVNSVDDNGKSALLYACEGSSMELVSLLLEKGANINQKSKEGSTSLHIASFHKQTEIVRLLLELNADINSVDDNRRSALFLACQSGSMELVSLLLKKGANINQKAIDGATSLHMAIFLKHTEIVRLLLESEADVNSLKDKDISPLIFACDSGRKELVSLLLENGADINAFTLNGNSPLMIAANKGFEDIVKMLLDRDDINLDPRLVSNKEFILKNIKKLVKTKIEKMILDKFNALRSRYNSVVTTTPKSCDVQSKTPDSPPKSLLFAAHGASSGVLNKISTDFKNTLSQLGLSYVTVPADGDCFYRAVGNVVGKSIHELRNSVADYLKTNKTEYENIVSGLESSPTYEGYLDAVRSNLFAGQLEISILMKILDRPIKVVQDGGFYNESDFAGNGSSIYVYYSANHFDSLLKLANFDEDEVMNSLSRLPRNSSSEKNKLRMP